VFDRMDDAGLRRPSESGAGAVGAARRGARGGAVADADASDGASEFATDAAAASAVTVACVEDGSKDTGVRFEAESDSLDGASADNEDADGGESTPADASEVEGSAIDESAALGSSATTGGGGNADMAVSDSVDGGSFVAMLAVADLMSLLASDGTGSVPLCASGDGGDWKAIAQEDDESEPDEYGDEESDADDSPRLQRQGRERNRIISAMT
jgi:hypothetical protein